MFGMQEALMMQAWGLVAREHALRQVEERTPPSVWTRLRKKLRNPVVPTWLRRLATRSADQSLGCASTTRPHGST